ncbi:carboxypeptidase-like regulatory domain-containing protein [Hymenobacter sp. 15J16-1T3B]|uniref:carboxypeptidase-like regulatory domain-containing protein n=1 Tax=Hymenobacter sp. 15J16-1T3B TaxID=2886941 RepID=UPI001D102BEF|nr:carboxypeptidase-like regulatory domain-containing protein [Hymenobacter sp. 15J16-1T3B]MCC3157633.1 carboxypeptidase-like regulatory domain-containing protein [Hymenobacter sp. 15J16-1T3B]
MKLSATPFHRATGELLPAYRDAYLRGDLSSENTVLVDAYLKANKELADETLRRFYDMKNAGHSVKPVGWVQRQFDLIRTEPERFRRRAAAMVMGGALIGGAVFAGTNLPTANTPTDNLPAVTESVEASNSEAASALRMTAVRGRILDENGRPLVGATVLHKGTSTGVSTDANGVYTLRVPVGQKATLQYAYGGYAEEEMQVRAGATENVTLVPRAPERAAKKRWLFF